MQTPHCVQPSVDAFVLKLWGAKTLFSAVAGLSRGRWLYGTGGGGTRTLQAQKWHYKVEGTKTDANETVLRTWDQCRTCTARMRLEGAREEGGYRLGAKGRLQSVSGWYQQFVQQIDHGKNIKEWWGSLMKNIQQSTIPQGGLPGDCWLKNLLMSRVVKFSHIQFI